MTDKDSEQSTITEKIVLVLDFDDTIVINNEGYRFIEKKLPIFLEELHKKDNLLFISSRNPPYKVINEL